MENWFVLAHPDKIDTPALLVYRDRVARNIDLMVKTAGDASRLIPHVKTHKMREVVEMQLDKGIRRFKCATIAEAEMLALAGASAVLVAYQLNGPKIDRYLELVGKYPRIVWSSIVDNIDSARALAGKAQQRNVHASVFLDIDSGMHRTGIPPEDALELARDIKSIKNLRLLGLHAYDGHIRDTDFATRTERAEAAMRPVRELARKMTAEGFDEPLIIAGGTPTFTVHAKHKDLWCSPGTCVFSDHGYGSQLKEQHFQPAVVLMTRVVSRPGPGLVTTDLGHKSVAAENPIDKRIFFLNLEGYEVVSQSEEHLVIRVPEGREPEIGAVLYGLPYHVCPSVALHDEAIIIVDGEEVDVWPVLARRRSIGV
ncbi:D-TA family PLP-dependent enzyme [Dinghuibacter silviterrae]|uniref:D-serine deaminase-like pyridoxal phosphate-dependent protein n=1 Tax=Dinghuibacter silviterrae TaxID=1539049 RepID=A0A4R8DFB6_9BACT|nr:D-TA family PLP-dependent enzyme [Dinghuibacter silviterrae]TDW96279.1 D-serine deaminase-like pyridoxal phosphate-dependent protein [Dinghuibacter silviterrae]